MLPIAVLDRGFHDVGGCPIRQHHEPKTKIFMDVPVHERIHLVTPRKIPCGLFRHQDAAASDRRGAADGGSGSRPNSETSPSTHDPHRDITAARHAISSTLPEDVPPWHYGGQCLI